VGFQPTKRVGRVVTAADEKSAERRGWLSHGLAALGISALGLAVAASVALTTSAQTNDITDAPADLPVVAVPANGKAGPAAAKQSARQSAALAAYTRRDAAVERTSRSAALQVAIVKEQAAQRDEELAKAADEITQAARAATSDARQEKLTEADRASRRAAAELAQEKVRRAVAARVAAAGNREAAESESTTSESTPPDVSNIPSGGGVSPVPGAVIGAHFGQYGMWSRYHTGLDFRAGYGTPIRAVKAGVVLFSGSSGDWAGNHVAIRHADGKTTMSSHMSSMAVRSGQSVQAGQVIGYVGQTGRAFGAHLHFELYPVGVKYGDVYKAINPVPWLSANGVHTR